MEEVLIALGLLVLGLALIVKGGGMFVDAASWMAEASGIPKLIVGATVVSIATSLPEQFTSIIAALQGKVDMAVGNAVGSVTANVGLIMAVSLLFLPGAIRRRDYLPKSLLMLAAATTVLVAGQLGSVSLPVSAVLLTILGIFIWENVASARRAMGEDKGREDRPKVTRGVLCKELAFFVLGTAGIVIGSNLLVNSASTLARIVGVSERVIGVTVVAVGTSLPELVTTLTAIVKKQGSLSVGNILGANIIDMAMILPMCTLTSGQALPISAGAAAVDVPIALAVCAVGVVPALVQKKFSRWQGVALLAMYIGYLGYTCLGA